jgi:hypothetical protein
VISSPSAVNCRSATSSATSSLRVNAPAKPISSNARSRMPSKLSGNMRSIMRDLHRHTEPGFAQGRSSRRGRERRGVLPDESWRRDASISLPGTANTPRCGRQAHGLSPPTATRRFDQRGFVSTLRSQYLHLGFGHENIKNCTQMASTERLRFGGHSSQLYGLGCTDPKSKNPRRHQDS